MKFTCELTRIENPNEQQLGRKPARHDHLAWSEDPPFLREHYSLFPKRQRLLFWVSSYMSLWSNILFNFAVLINVIVAFFYPFQDDTPIWTEQR
uniref:SFRICE_037618 n=1 Tax=Spodoptera frugiperda TaxID=7108 RepID=A0A2H1VTW9_SPOFR